MCACLFFSHKYFEVWLPQFLFVSFTQLSYNQWEEMVNSAGMGCLNPHISKKGLSSRLIFDWLLGDDLWALGIFCLVVCFVCWALSHAVPIWPGKLIPRMWFIVNAGFAKGGGARAGVRGAEVSHTGTACLHDWLLIKLLDTKAQVSFLVGNTLHVLWHIIAERIRGVLMWLHWERTPGSCAWFL